MLISSVNPTPAKNKIKIKLKNQQKPPEKNKNELLRGTNLVILVTLVIHEE